MQAFAFGSGAPGPASRWERYLPRYVLSNKLPNYTTINLISYYWITPGVRIYLNVDNLFDATYYDRAFQNRYATPGAPRTIMGGVAARF